ncbi:MAG: ParB/RepB/Spo0J family partition protein [Clostridia bacterium]|nr:ParB/RepB/Spo0J family partition protein [Clostridia bacterium]
MARKGLGKGLDALMAIYGKDEEKKSIQEFILEKEAKNEDNANKVIEISLSMIDPDKNQPRKNFNEESLNELADSIKVHGVIQPIVVTKVDDRFKIIAGERRWRASKICGNKTIPCIIKNYTPQQIREISIVENLQREDLNPIESARAIKELMEEFNWTHEQLAERLGKSRPVITNTIRLLNLEPEVIEMVESGKLSAGHARTLVTVTDREIQLKLARQVQSRNLTVRDLENASKENKKTQSVSKPTPQSNELREFSKDLQRVFGTKVSIIGDDNRGKIQIEYFNFNDLQRIFDLVEKIKRY